jgi:glycosyltransferase involved in cell wall biosynthesis
MPSDINKSLCIIKGYKPLISETFIQSHIDRLAGDKVVLYNYYPEYTYQGRTIRYFYSKNPLFKKTKRLLPQFLYDRWITRNEKSAKAVEDFITGFFQHHGVDVILAEYGFNGADICSHARQLDIPLVVHFHGHDAHRETDLAPYRERFRQMFDYVYRIISVSRFMTKKLIDLGADESKIVYNPYGAREYFFDIEPDYRSTLFAVGSFVDIKAPYLTVMAFRQLLESEPDARLVMVGDGPLRETCLSLVQTWGLESRVSFPGALRHEEFLPLMAQACAFVQHSVTTSYGDSEGTPNSILEAGAAGLPVISTRHAGITDAVVNGKTGLLVEERDVPGMAEAMRVLVRDKSLCRDMGQFSREHIREHYNIKRHIDCLQDIIDEARER